MARNARHFIEEGAGLERKKYILFGVGDESAEHKNHCRMFGRAVVMFHKIIVSLYVRPHGK